MDKRFRQSMLRRGNCWNNASQESFIGHMKDHIKERILFTTFTANLASGASMGMPRICLYIGGCESQIVEKKKR